MQWVDGCVRWVELVGWLVLRGRGGGGWDEGVIY